MIPSDDRDLKVALDALDARQIPLSEPDWEERLLHALSSEPERLEPRPTDGHRGRRNRMRLLLVACLALTALLLFMSSGAGAWLGLPSPMRGLLDRSKPEPPKEQPAVVLPSGTPSHAVKPSHSAKASPAASASRSATPSSRPSAVSTPLANVTPPPSWPQDPATAGAVRWTRQRSGTRDDLAAVDFVGNNGWAVGMGVVVSTSDGGATWSRQDTGHAGWLFGVDFTSASRGWAVGGTYGAAVLGTEDGGSSWVQQAQVEGSLRSVTAAGDGGAWAAGAVGDHGRVLATNDGGASWIEQDTGQCSALNDVCSVDAEHGWAVGYDGEIVATRDGGASWAPQPSRTAATLSSVTFLDENRGWAAGTVGTGLYRSRAVLLGTSDGGASWRRLTLGDRGTAFTDIVFTSQLAGWAVARYERDAVLVVTEDGGRTWRTQTVLRHGRLQGLAAVASRACAVGARGSVFLSAPDD